MSYRDRGNFRTSTVEIEEARDGSEWVLRWDPGLEERHPAAADALKAVRDRDRVMADAGFSVISTVRWTAHTGVGQLVVRVLQ